MTACWLRSYAPSRPRSVTEVTVNPSTEENVQNIVSALETGDYWPGGLPGVSNEYVGFGPDRLPEQVISCWSYIRNMTTLIDYLKNDHSL